MKILCRPLVPANTEAVLCKIDKELNGKYVNKCFRHIYPVVVFVTACKALFPLVVNCLSGIVPLLRRGGFSLNAVSGIECIASLSDISVAAKRAGLPP